MVTSTRFELVNAAVKGRCVKPLHQLANINGARNRTRTCDLPVNSRTLYRLSYSGTPLLLLHNYYFFSIKLESIFNFDNLTNKINHINHKTFSIYISFMKALL